MRRGVGHAMTARPERVPAEEIRQRMLEAGRELANEAGAALTIEHLRLEEVIQRARVPRSSVYRLWPYRDDYIDDLLCHLAGGGSWFSDRPVLDPGTFADVRQILAENAGLLATLEGRRSLLCEITRVTVTRNYAGLTESTPWRLHMALVATLGSTRSGQARKRIAAALEDSQRRSREMMVAVLVQLASVVGLRPRDPSYTLDHIALAGGLVVQSLALRNVQIQAAIGAPEGPGMASASDTALVDGLLNGPLPGPGLHGQQAEWSLAAFVYLGVLDAFIELDPDFTPGGAPLSATNRA
jgi:AcrR family transcriptional regulator